MEVWALLHQKVHLLWRDLIFRSSWERVLTTWHLWIVIPSVWSGNISLKALLRQYFLWYIILSGQNHSEIIDFWWYSTEKVQQENFWVIISFFQWKRCFWQLMWNGYLPCKCLLFIQIMYMVLVLPLVAFGKIAFKNQYWVKVRSRSVPRNTIQRFLPAPVAVTKGVGAAVSQPC